MFDEMELVVKREHANQHSAKPNQTEPNQEFTDACDAKNIITTQSTGKGTFCIILFYYAQ